MPDPKPPNADVPHATPADERHMTRQMVISLRRAYQAELDAPVPDHLQRLVEALHRGLKEKQDDRLP